MNDKIKKIRLKRILDAIEVHKKDLVTEDQVVDMMKQEVFSNVDFKRHLSETAKKLDIPYEKVDYVIKHYLLINAKQMSIVTRIRRRISIHGFFMIEIKELVSYYYDQTEENFIKMFGKTITKKLLSIFKY